MFERIEIGLPGARQLAGIRAEHKQVHQQPCRQRRMNGDEPEMRVKAGCRYMTGRAKPFTILFHQLQNLDQVQKYDGEPAMRWGSVV